MGHCSEFCTICSDVCEFCKKQPYACRCISINETAPVKKEKQEMEKCTNQGCWCRSVEFAHPAIAMAAAALVAERNRVQYVPLDVGPGEGHTGGTLRVSPVLNSSVRNTSCVLCGVGFMIDDVRITGPNGLSHGLGQCPTAVPMPSVAAPQPLPTKNERPAIADLVKADIDSRAEMGEKKYGTKLQPHNGRDTLMDAYQEVIDLTKYLRQMLFERDGK